jgi:hypothetical protein
MKEWICTGGDRTVLHVEGSDRSMEDWYELMLKFIQRISDSDVFEVKDNGYQRVPGVLVTDGIDIQYQFAWFSIWSDEPGEIVLVHDNLSNKKSIRACRELERIWNELYT